MAGGRYWFVATAPYKNMPYTVAVRGVGLANDGPRDVRVEALAVVRMYSPRSPGSGNPASYVPYAVFSNKDGEFKDRSKVIAHPEDGGKGMYVNGKLKIGGKPTLTGDLSVTGKISGLNKLYPKPWGVYKRTQRAAREPMPEVDLAYYRSIADEVYSGDLVLGTGKKATSVDLSHPTVIYVDGKLTIKGKLKGVGIIVAAKGVKIEGDVTYDGGDACWAIISADKVKIKNGAKVYGGIYAHSPKKNKGRIDMAKNSEVVGFVVGDRVKLKKDAKVEWDPRIAPMAGLPGGLPIGGQPLVDVIAWGRL
jgi:cytoskeletal protein CcmA (bactofilin family)